MKNKIYIFSSILLIILSFCLGIILYPYLPSPMASHWNIMGQADGYSSKFSGTFLLPIFMLIILASLKIFQKLDPKANNIKKFEATFNSFILALNFFFFNIFLLTLAWNLGVIFNFNKFSSLLFAFLFYFIGNLVKASRQNYFIGIRTPWTLNSEIVWDKTNRIGAKFFYFISGLCLVGFVYPDILWIFIIFPLTFFVLWVFVYSYLEFKKL